MMGVVQFHTKNTKFRKLLILFKLKLSSTQNNGILDQKNLKLKFSTNLKKNMY